MIRIGIFWITSEIADDYLLQHKGAEEVISIPHGSLISHGGQFVQTALHEKVFRAEARKLERLTFPQLALSFASVIHQSAPLYSN